MIKRNYLVLLLVIIVFVSGCAQTDVSETDLPDPEPIPDTDVIMTDGTGEIIGNDPFENSYQDLESELPEIVAIINGNEIHRYSVLNIKMQMVEQGIPITTEEVLDQLIIKELIIDEAKRQGYEASQTAVESIFIMEGFSVEEVKELVELQGFTYREFIEQQKQDMLFFFFIEDLMKDIEITDQEAQEFYQEISYEIDESYEDIKEDLKFFLAQERLDVKIINLASELMEDSELELFI